MRLNFLKPWSSAVASYVPGVRLLAMKDPSPLETVSRYMPVSWLRTVTVTPGSAPRRVDDAAAHFGRALLREQRGREQQNREGPEKPS